MRTSALPELIVGGGLGVAYVEGEEAPTHRRSGRTCSHAAAEQHGVPVPLAVEPGRSIVASAAVTLYTVGTIKDLPGIRTYLAVDGGMSDNPRPVLYGSGYEAFLPRETERGSSEVGAHRRQALRVGRCARAQRESPRRPRRRATSSCTPVTGAYGHSMGSNYNKVPRPAVVFVKDGGREGRRTA